MKCIFHYISLALVLFSVLTVTEGFFLNSLRRWYENNNESKPGLCPWITQLSPQDQIRHESLPSFGDYLDKDEDFRSNGRSLLDPPDSLCGNLCTTDNQCAGFRKCCPTTCGYACYDPVVIKN